MRVTKPTLPVAPVRRIVGFEAMIFVSSICVGGGAIQSDCCLDVA